MKHQFNKQNAEKVAPLFLIIISFFVLTMPLQQAYAVVTIDWATPLGVPFTEGSAGSGSTILFTVTDTDFIGGGISTIPVQITSSVDPTGMTLTFTESGADDGTFTNTKLIFMDGNDKFTVSDTATITIEDAAANTNSFAIETLTGGIDGVTIVSDTDLGGISIDLTETGPDTGIFTRTLRFSTIASDAATATILVAGGDVVTIVDEVTSFVTNALIIPNPSDVGAISAVIGGTVTATYGGVSTPVDVQDDGATGRGGGGLARPGLVFDFVAALSSGGSDDTTSPSLAISRSQITGLALFDEILSSILEADPFTPISALYDQSIDYPLSINENGFLLSQFANTIQTFQGNTGKPIQLKLNLFDSTGVEHVALYTNLRGYEREIHNSDTYIIYDQGKPLEIIDPQGFFSTVDFTVSDEGTKYLITYDIVFAKPMDTSDIIIRAWDQKRNSGDVKIFDAIKIAGKPVVEPGPDTLVQTDTTSMSIPYFKVLKFLMPVADSSGNLRYYNSFGDLEQKQTHPYYEPFIYPKNVGRAERHDDGFQNAISAQDLSAQALAQTLIGNHFTDSEDRPMRQMFVYPSNVGKVDREDVDALQKTMLDEHAKATKYCYKRYHTNDVED